MSQHTIGRRQVVRTAAAVAAGGALVGGTGIAAASASGTSGASGVLGAWWVTHTDNPPGDPTPGISVVSFAEGGAFAATDIRPAGVTGVGAWTATSSNRFRVSYWAAVPLEPGAPGGSINIRVRGHVNGDSVGGTYAVTIYDPTGAQLQTGTGTFTGSRLMP